MTTTLTTASVTSSIQQVLEMMVAADVGRIIVTNKEVPVGIFTEKDVLKRVVNSNIDPGKSLIKEVMTSPIRAVREETHIIEAFGKMYRGKYRHLLVRGKRGKIVGIVSMRCILGIAVELGQGLSETKTIGSPVWGEPFFEDKNPWFNKTITLMIKKGSASFVFSPAE